MRLGATAFFMALLVAPTAIATTHDWYLDTLGVRGLAEQGIDGSGIVVAVLDSGFQHDLPAFEDRIWRNPGEVPGNGRDDDLNGYIDDVEGWDMCHDAPARARPGRDHGTFVAGILGADGDVHGVAPGVTLMDVQVFCDDDTYPQRDGFLDIDVLREGLRYATAMGADIISMSLQKWPDQPPGLVAGLLPAEEEFQAAHDAGIFLVGAAGNLGQPGPSKPGSLPHVFTVGATTGCGFRHGFSNYGAGIDLWAPGSAFSFLLGGAAVWQEGTSFATPMVSGAAALLLQREPHLSPGEVAERLLAAATTSEDGPALDLHRAFDVPRPPAPPAPAYVGPTTIGPLHYLQFARPDAFAPLLDLDFADAGRWCMRLSDPDASFFVGPEGLPQPLTFRARFHGVEPGPWTTVTLQYNPKLPEQPQVHLLTQPVAPAPGQDAPMPVAAMLAALGVAVRTARGLQSRQPGRR